MKSERDNPAQTAELTGYCTFPAEGCQCTKKSVKNFKEDITKGGVAQFGKEFLTGNKDDKKMVDEKGIEPSAPALRTRCSPS